MQFMFWILIIIFLLIISLLVNRYENKIKNFQKLTASMREDIENLKAFVEKNRMLIETNRSNIEDIVKKQENKS